MPKKTTIHLPSLKIDTASASKHLCAQDKTLKHVIKQVGECTLVIEDIQSTFETLMESIIYQQLTSKAASAILNKVKALYNSTGFPLPADILDTTSDTLRSAGLSGSKTLAIKDLAARTLAGEIPDIDALHQMEDSQIINILTKVRGIGVWTVQMLLIFRLGRPDILPSNDYGVRKGFAKAYKRQELPTPKELENYGERWQPYRSIASWYLWQILEVA